MNDELLNKILNEFLVTPDALDIIKNLDENKIKEIINDLSIKNINIIDKITIEKYINNNDNNKNVVVQEKKIEVKTNNKNTILSFINKIEKEKSNDSLKVSQQSVIEVKREIVEQRKRFVGEEIETNVKDITKEENKIGLLSIIKNFDIQKNKPDIISWVTYYKRRLEKIKEILKEHNELKSVYPLSNIPRDKKVGIVGIIYDKRIKENGVMFIIEDGNATLKVYVSKENFEKDYNLIRDIPLDSVIGFVGTLKGNIFFADQVILPDVPNNKYKTINDEIYIAFTGDWQLGSKYVINKVLDNFIKFINAKTGIKELDNLARKIGYLSIIGDVVDGVGIYPNQNEELIYKTYEEQYELFEKYLLQIPEYIKIMIIPGNHDIPRLAEPQPPLPKFLLKDAYQMKNIYFLSNPSYVLIHNTFKILLYHGYVMDWFVSEIPYIRENGGYENAENIMKMQLMLRHLAPTHGSTPYVPYIEEDPLVISEVPDIFHTGHIHRAIYSSYKGIDLINSSTFQDITPFQIELGHKPVPGILYLKNLSSTEVYAINLNDLSLIKVRDKL